MQVKINDQAYYYKRNETNKRTHTCQFLSATQIELVFKFRESLNAIQAIYLADIKHRHGSVFPGSLPELLYTLQRVGCNG